MSKQSEALAKINVGTSRATLKAEKSSPMDFLLIGIMQEVVDRLGVSLDKYNISASNRLKQSIATVEVSADGNELTVGVEASAYWKFINFGVNGSVVNHGAPTWGQQPSSGQTFKAAISGWVRDRGIQKPEKFKTYDDFVFAIMRNIKLKGKKPRPFVTDVINDKLKAELSKAISEIYKKAIVINVLQPKIT
jgi:hypothetical protein